MSYVEKEKTLENLFKSFFFLKERERIGVATEHDKTLFEIINGQIKDEKGSFYKALQLIEQSIDKTFTVEGISFLVYPESRAEVHRFIVEQEPRDYIDINHFLCPNQQGYIFKLKFPTDLAITDRIHLIDAFTKDILEQYTPDYSDYFIDLCRSIEYSDIVHLQEVDGEYWSIYAAKYSESIEDSLAVDADLLVYTPEIHPLLERTQIMLNLQLLKVKYENIIKQQQTPMSENEKPQQSMDNKQDFETIQQKSSLMYEEHYLSYNTMHTDRRDNKIAGLVGEYDIFIKNRTVDNPQIVSVAIQSEESTDIGKITEIQEKTMSVKTKQMLYSVKNFIYAIAEYCTTRLRLYVERILSLFSHHKNKKQCDLDLKDVQEVENTILKPAEVITDQNYGLYSENKGILQPQNLDQCTDYSDVVKTKTKPAEQAYYYSSVFKSVDEGIFVSIIIPKTVATRRTC